MLLVWHDEMTTVGIVKAWHAERELVAELTRCR